MLLAKAIPWSTALSCVRADDMQHLLKYTYMNVRFSTAFYGTGIQVGGRQVPYIDALDTAICPAHHAQKYTGGESHVSTSINGQA